MISEYNIREPYRRGRIEVICGSMFSGKTEELIRRLKRAKFAHQRVEIFKPAIDTRYSEQDVVSHDNNTIHSTPIESSGSILLFTSEIDVVGIDEAQFFDDGLVHVSQISNQWLENPVTALQVGQEIEAKILDINVEKEKMTLSIKALLPEIEKPAKESASDEGKGKKRGTKKDDDELFELHEWKDTDNAGASIAELLGNSDK